MGTSKQYFESAKKKGIFSLAITDHNTMGGVLDFLKRGKDSEIDVLIGVEFEFNSGTFEDQIPIVLICKDQVGYMNLCRLITICNENSGTLIEANLYEYKEGLICISAELEQKDSLEKIFKEDLFFEICPYPSRKKNNEEICKYISLDRVIASCDAHMPEKEDKVLQDIMINNSTWSDGDQSFSETRYLMSLKDTITSFVALGQEVPKEYILSGIKNANSIAKEFSNIELKFKDQIVNYPHLLHPLNPDGVDKETLLMRIIEKNNRFDLSDPIYSDRLKYEIEAISKNDRVNLIDYFLVLEDLCRFCSENDIPVGPGRGSGAGSLTLYGLNVTHLDPIKFGLLFERFISKGRIEAGTLPDVDLDFADQEIVRQYLIGLYGEDRVKPIGTYQTLAVRGAIKDAFRYLYPEVEFKKVNFINSLIDDSIEVPEDSNFFETQLVENEAFSLALEPYQGVRDAVAKLVGYNRQPGVHPCGLAITQDPVEDIMPMRLTKRKWVLEFSADYCEQSGIVKYDILGLKTLKFFQLCLKLIEKRYKGSKIEYPKTIYDIPQKDLLTFEAFERGDTESVFQFNSNVAKNILTKIKVNSLDDLSMVTSVGRPGPMENGQHYVFIRRKNGREESKPPHPALEELLKDTFGIMIYQESVMKAAQILGGFSLAEADTIRKAMGKKKIEIIKPFKDRFIKHCQKEYPDTLQQIPKKDGDSISQAEHIWNLMETFSGYGFNKSHSMSYTLIGYICQYLKVHYPLEWWCACLQNAGDPSHTKAYYNAAKKYVVPPKVSDSKADYYIEYFDKVEFNEYDEQIEGFIHMPFSVVKGVGDKAANAIESEAPYSSFSDFFERVNKRQVNKKVVINLIFAGAFSIFEMDKEKLLREYYELRKEIKKIPPEYQNITRDYEVEMKHKVLDFLVMDYIEMYPHHLSNCKYVSDISSMDHEDSCSIVGKITRVVKRKTKRKETFLIINVTNNDEEIEVVAWPETTRFYQDKLNENVVVRVDGKVKKDWGDKLQFTGNSFFTLKEVLHFGGPEI